MIGPNFIVSRKAIQGTGPPAVTDVLSHMSVDHGSADIGVTKEFLKGSDVGSALKSLGSKGMAQDMARDPLFNPGSGNRVSNGPRIGFGMDVVASLNATS